MQGLWWLSFEQEFGLKEPLVLDLSILKLTFALTFRINIASIVGVLISVFVYRKSIIRDKFDARKECNLICQLK